MGSQREIMTKCQDLEDFDKRKNQNNDWQASLKHPQLGPARFIQTADLHDLSTGPYKRVTRAEAEAGAQCRVYADGVYDVFHSGHARQLMQAKAMFPNVLLIVGCSNDVLVHSKKGKTVCTDEERYESLRHCRYVDMILPSGPWYYSTEFFDRHRIDFIAHDEEPYTIGGSSDSYALPKSLDMFCATQRTEGISTSDIITRIVKVSKRAIFSEGPIFDQSILTHLFDSELRRLHKTQFKPRDDSTRLERWPSSFG